jgi:hypothetical protein
MLRRPEPRKFSCLSKWFYDTFIGAATGAAHCGSFVGGVVVLLLEDVLQLEPIVFQQREEEGGQRWHQPG